ncbi:hypothetical protein Tco_0241467 [Tanacetum coccineum]
MVTYIQKSEGSEGFHQIVDFLNICHTKIETWKNTATKDGKVKIVSEASIRRHLKLEDSDGLSTLPITNEETEVPRLSSPTQTHIADEAASTGVDDIHGGAATTVSGLKAGKFGDDLKQQRKPMDDEAKGGKSMILEPTFEFLLLKGLTAGAEDRTAARKVSITSKECKQREKQGKAIMEESEPTQTKTKIQQEQERLGFEETLRLQEQFVKKKAKGLKRVNTFTLMESDDTVPKVVAGSSKRSAEEELDELSQEQLQQLIIIVLEEGMNVEDMLKNFDRDDLVKLWDLVRERSSSTEPTDDKERALWVELKRLFEPDTDDLLELQRYMHDPLTWRLYDTCGVHHVSIETG